MESYCAAYSVSFGINTESCETLSNEHIGRVWRGPDFYDLDIGCLNDDDVWWFEYFIDRNMFAINLVYTSSYRLQITFQTSTNFSERWRGRVLLASVVPSRREQYFGNWISGTHDRLQCQGTQE